MSLDNIQLSNHICQILFTDNLVEPLQAKDTDNYLPKTIINSLGENKKNILFLVNNAQNKFLSDDEMDMLSNLITACKLSMADIALVNYHTHNLNYRELTNHFQPKKILIFGITTSALELPFAIPLFQIQQFQEQQYIIAPALSEFLNNKNLKKELWTCLQKLFLSK